MNDEGQIAFTAALLHGAGGVTTENESGLWRAGRDGMTLVAREGNRRPVLPLGQCLERSIILFRFILQFIPQL